MKQIWENVTNIRKQRQGDKYATNRAKRKKLTKGDRETNGRKIRQCDKREVDIGTNMRKMRQWKKISENVTNMSKQRPLDKYVKNRTKRENKNWAKGDRETNGGLIRQCDKREVDQETDISKIRQWNKYEKMWQI